MLIMHLFLLAVHNRGIQYLIPSSFDILMYYLNTRYFPSVCPRAFTISWSELICMFFLHVFCSTDVD